MILGPIDPLSGATARKKGETEPPVAEATRSRTPAETRPPIAFGINETPACPVKTHAAEAFREITILLKHISSKVVPCQGQKSELGVVAMHKGDSPPKRLPKAISDNKIQVVPWNQKELAKAIKTQSEKR
jgi:hypothetical protein